MAEASVPPWAALKHSQKRSGVRQLREGDGRGETGEERADFAGPWGVVRMARRRGKMELE